MRRPRQHEVPVAAVGVALMVLANTACDADANVLIGNDARVDDAGFVDAGFVDAGFSDAGFPDAGLPDAGPQTDAGFPCPFPNNPPQELPCEDDADFCDPVESQFSPEADILATWSYVDGEEFVLQARFLAPPFRLVRDLHLQVMIGEATSADYGAVIVRNPEDVLYGDVVYGLQQDRRFPHAWGYPPQTRYVGSRQNDSPEFDECWFRLSTTTGLIELRLPIRAVPDRVYAIGAISGDDVPPTSDVTWSAVPAFLTSRGGRADDDNTLVSICDLTCPF